MSEIKTKDVYVFDAGNEAALSAVMKLVGCAPNQVVPMTSAEFKAFNDCVVKLRIEAPTQ